MMTGSNRLPLTGRQTAVLNYIRDHRDLNGYPPSCREIGKAFGISSPNGVRVHLKALHAKGYIEVTPMLSRGIQILDAPSPIPDDPAEYASADRWPSWTNAVSFVPTNMDLQLT